eukprot:4207075-Amphidinium_carterae.1
MSAGRYSQACTPTRWIACLGRMSLRCWVRMQSASSQMRAPPSRHPCGGMQKGAEPKEAIECKVHEDRFTQMQELHANT